jgi:two-component system response regulator PilR (NtrC family)
MPPLRACREDVPAIAAAVLERLAQQNAVPVPKLSEAALTELKAYDFPGNIRELENILERAMALSGSEQIQAEDLRLRPLPGEAAQGEAPAEGGREDTPLPEYLDRVEREAILEALARTGYNRTAAAKLLGVTFRTLRYRMQRLGIREPESDAGSN